MFLFVYVFMALDFSVDFSSSSSSFFVSCCCVPNCVFCFFFMLPLLLPPPLFSFIYLLSDCVCVCQLLLSAVCLRVCVQVTHFILLFSVFFFRLLKNSLIYSQLKRKKPTVILSFFLCACVLIPTRLLCVFVVFFSVDYRWVSGCLYFIYLCVCMCVLCDYHRHRRKKMTNKEKFCFVVMHGKTTELDSFFFFLTA